MSIRSMSPGTPKPEIVALPGNACALSSTRWPLPAKWIVLEPRGPPLFTSSVPPLSVVTPPMAPPDTTTVPPDPTLVLLATPPDSTACVAPAPDT